MPDLRQDALQDHMDRARRYRLQGLDYAQQALIAPVQARPVLNLMAHSWFELADRQEALARIEEPRSFDRS